MVSHSVRGTFLILFHMYCDGDSNDSTARPSLRGCVSKLSVMMVSSSISSLKPSLINTNRHGNRDGYVHEGEELLQYTITSPAANISQEVAKVIHSFDAVALYQKPHLRHGVDVDCRSVVNLPLTSEICSPSRTRTWSEPDVLPGA